MKKLIITALSIISFNLGYCQGNNMEVLQKQVEYFNNGDVDGMVENVTDDFKYFYITPDSLVIECEGKEEFRKSMEAYFDADYRTRSRITEFIESGNQITFEEVVQFETKNGTQESKSLATYTFRDGKICRTWYFIE